ncbi:alpha/beta fold hydrolase [Methylopila musalis]|uniref:Alpha/beta fold hydrolase n=1 Tax=Methylopila musalis TaxID=1134781 RepID=A0ABW3Z9T7_9HYPH
MTDALTPSPSAPVAEPGPPWLWPVEAALRLAGSGLDFLEEAAKIACPPPPRWATANTVRLDLPTMRLRAFGDPEAGTIPVLIDAPYAGHSATIADYDVGQSLVATLLANGVRRAFVTDWKPATPEMRNFSIDTYLAELNVAIDDLGGAVHLVGLCQGGWLSAMLAARFPAKVTSLVLAGSPIDTDAGDGPIRRLAHDLPMESYRAMVEMGDGLMPGRFMLTGWKNMHPAEQYVDRFVTLYTHMSDRNHLDRTETFASWYETPLDLPGAYYLQAIEQLFKQNLLAKGAFVGLGRRIDLGRIRCPVYLLAGENDDITTPEQVFAARGLVGTAPDDVTERLVPGGHIGLFMGRRTLAETWPDIARWIERANG